MARNSQRGPFREGKKTRVFGIALLIPLVSAVYPLGAASRKSNFIAEDQNSRRLLQFSPLNDQIGHGDKSNLLTEIRNSVDKEFKLLANKSLDQNKKELFLIAEVVIKGLDNHPDQKRLKYAAYDAMKIRPGSKVTKEEVKRDLEAIYSSGWFSGVTIDPIDTPLGIGLVVNVQPNPLLTKVLISPIGAKLKSKDINKIFYNDYKKTLNLNVLQLRIKEIKKWYVDQGFSLARVSGPSRISPEGVVELKIQEGIVDGIEITFINDDGETEYDDGRKVKGKTRKWVIERELSTKPGDVFNRNKLEKDIKRLYATSLFNDLKVTLKPVPGEAGRVLITLGVTEQRTGTLTGGIGYSGAQGVFGQGGLQESNFLGRSWKANFNLSYGEFGGLLNLSLTDPWIKGDKYRTSLRTSLFASREVPTELRSNKSGHITGVSDRYEPPNSYTTAYSIASTIPTGISYSSVDLAKAGKSDVSWFDNKGDSIVLQRTGGAFSFARPLNGGDPFKRSSWTLLTGMNFQKVEPVDYAGSKRPYGVVSTDIVNNTVGKESIICVAYNCADENTLVSFKVGSTYNNLNDQRNPTSGDFLSLTTDQYVSVGNNSPTFNRARLGYSYFVPLNLIKLHKGCRPKRGEKLDCSQTIGFQLKTGTIIGDLPPYEAFCLGGSSSVRGWGQCNLGVSRSFGEASVEYRYPIWRRISGALFVDAGSDFGSQSKVPGKPGELLDKPGAGFSLGTGFVVNTPVGPLRLEAASKDFGDDWRYNLGVGWKF